MTSARDLAILGRALLQQFPESASLFNIGAMQLGGSITANHNGMLGRYPGADGMKTGFTCPAGYNLVASATHGGQKLIAVVLGAPTPASRTAKTAALLDRAFQTGSPMGSLEVLAERQRRPARLARQGVRPPRQGRQGVHGRGRGYDDSDQRGADRKSRGRRIGRRPAVGQRQGSRAFAASVFHAGRRLCRPRAGLSGSGRARPPGGRSDRRGAEATAYTGEKREGSDASPISQPAPDAKPLRAAAVEKHARHGKHVKHAKAAATTRSERHAASGENPRRQGQGQGVEGGRARNEKASQEHRGQGA